MSEFKIKPRGRPKDLECHKRIVSAARDLFLEHGMQAVSVDGIARAAGVSNRTVYSHFVNKEDLLKAVIVSEAETMRPEFPSERPTNIEEFRDQLISFGTALIRLLSSPNIVGLGRLMISEAIRHPNMASQFFEWGPKQSHTRMQELLVFANNKKWIATTTPDKAAQHLIAMWQGLWHLRQQLGLAEPLTRKQIVHHATDCVEVFLKAFSKR